MPCPQARCDIIQGVTSYELAQEYNILCL